MTRSTRGEEYDREIPHRPSCLRQHSNAYSDDLKIDGEYLSHLRFADDMFIYANTPHELQQMLPELAYKSNTQSLMINKSKAKVMMENDTPVYMSTTPRSRKVLAALLKDS